MTPSDSRTAAEALFLAAADAGPAARAAILASAPADVRAEAEALLDADAHADEILGPVDGMRTILLDQLARRDAPEETDTDDLAPGTRVGPWTVEAEAGRGGMGSVYRARRDDGLYEQTVALKVVRRGMDTADVVARFERERAMLAGLHHAGIARLVDGGRAHDGRPYLVMEFVDGEPITTYADARRLGIEARLSLFVDACEAVAYAHRHLVVHRDIKPSNVYVSDAEGRPAVKLLDFGVARLLSPGAAETTLVGRLLTPAYAAPEQIAGGSVTTAADVYALGVLLYEMLTGHRPPASGGVPPRPSASVTDPTTRRSAGGEAQTRPPEALADARASSPARLARALRGDLDAVVLKALRPEPEARYATADALADDVRRSLAGLPVRARRGTARYRTAAFVRRHQAGVAAAALIAVVVVGSAFALAVQNRRLDRERARAEATTDFLRDLLGQANALQTGRGDVTVAEVLTAAARRIPNEFSDQPDIEAALLFTIGDAYTGLSKYREAEPVLRRSLALRRRFGGDDTETAAVLGVLATLLTERGTLDSSAAFQREAFAITVRLRGRRSLEAAHLLTRLAWTEKEQDHFDVAERLAREALRTADAIASEARAGGRGGPAADSAAVLEGALARSALSVLAMRRGNYAAAERLERSVLATRKARLGAQHPQSALSMSNLAKILQDAGGAARLAEALALTDAALAMRRRIGGDSSLAVLTSRSNRSLLLRDLGRDSEAVAEARRAYTTARDVFGEDHSASAYARYTLAVALDASGRPSEAEYVGALASHETIWGRDHPYTAYVLVPYARFRLGRGDAAGAIALAHPAVRARQGTLPPDTWLRAEAEATLGQALLAAGLYGEARPLLEHASDVLLRTRGFQDQTWRETRAALRTLRNAHRPNDARRAPNPPERAAQNTSRSA